MKPSLSRRGWPVRHRRSVTKTSHAVKVYCGVLNVSNGSQT